MVKKLDVFMKKNCKNNCKLQKEFRIEKALKRKGDNCMLNGKDVIINLIVGSIKKITYKNEPILS